MVPKRWGINSLKCIFFVNLFLTDSFSKKTFALRVILVLAPPLLFSLMKSSFSLASPKTGGPSLCRCWKPFFLLPLPHVHPKTASRASLAMLSISSSDTSILLVLFFRLKWHSLCLRRLANWEAILLVMILIIARLLSALLSESNWWSERWPRALM